MVQIGIGDDFKGGEIAQEKELSHKKSELDDVIEQLTEEYSDFIKVQAHIYKTTIAERDRKFLFYYAHEAIDRLIITPSIIKQFIRSSRPYGARTRYDPGGRFISAMIQAAYERGHNHFSIHDTDFSADPTMLGAQLHGKPGSPLCITFNGLQPMYSCEAVQHCKVIIDGTPGRSAGSFARASAFIIKSKATLRTFGYNARDCIFCAPHEDQLDTIYENAKGTNSFYLIQQDGSYTPYTPKL